MTKTLRIELPEELEQQLLEYATQANLSLSHWILQLLTQTILVKGNQTHVTDPILPLLGTLTCDVNDVGENHDTYLTHAL